MGKTACYLVNRAAWESGYSSALEEGLSAQGNFVTPDSVGLRYVPHAVFATEREAKAEAHRLEVTARVGRSPFWFSEYWDYLTEMSVEEAAARFVRKGLPAPPPRHPEDIDDSTWRTIDLWREWWDRESADWTAEQLADAWAVFNKLRFYDVVEIEMED